MPNPATRAYARALAATERLAQEPASPPCERLSRLRELGQHMTEMGDALVVEAIRAGRTWEEVGEATGLTKQGAHRRWHHLTVDEPAPPRTGGDPAGPAATDPETGGERGRSRQL